MENDNIKSKVIEMISNLFPNSGIDSDVLEYVDLIDDLGMDSMLFLSVVIELETAFDIIIPDDLLLMGNFSTIDKICSLVLQLIIAKTEKR